MTTVTDTELPDTEQDDTELPVAEAPAPAEPLDAEAIIPEPSGPITFQADDGLSFTVNVQRLKMRQLMKMLRILTVGLGSSITQLAFGPDDSAEDFGFALITAIAAAIPQAEDETVAFVRAMVELVPNEENFQKAPAGQRLSKAQREDNEAELAGQYEDFEAYMENPELEDLFLVIERVVKVEAPHIASLGKKVSAMLQFETKSVAEKPVASSRRNGRR